jgi:putative transposase
MSQFAPDPAAAPAVLTDRNTLEFTVQTLTDHFDLQAQGYCCQTRDLWQVVVAAAAQRSTLTATCGELRDAPASSTVRGYLRDQLTPAQVRPLEESFNRALASQLPRWFRRQLRHGLEWAIDLHDVPYYGKADQPDQAGQPGQSDDCWVCRGEAHVGTTRFYRCATAYVMLRDQRWTLAVTFVHPDDSTLTVLQRLLATVGALGLHRGCLYLDKGFCSVVVLRYLQEQTRLSAIVAAPLRGKVGSGGGLRALCRGRASYRTQHTFVSSEHGAWRVPVALVRTWMRQRDGQRQAQWLAYVLLRVPLSWSLGQVRQRYRARFGIESSYRLLEQVRARTTSPNAAWRFFYLGLALLIGNIWIALHWRYLRVCGSGPRRVARQHLTLERVAHFLRHAVEAIYGVVSVVHPPHVKSAIY